MPKPKIPAVVVFVTGGVVQSVHATEQMDCRVIDADNLEADGKRSSEIEKIQEKAIKGMTPIW